MNSQQASDLIQCLETVAAKPALFFGTVDVLLATVFLSGFHAALERTTDLEPGLGDQIVLDRGWKLPGATGPGIEHQMFESGLSPDQVIAELVAIEIEIVKRSSA